MDAEMLTVDPRGGLSSGCLGRFVSFVGLLGGSRGLLVRNCIEVVEGVGAV
jgi:hypothetical protein